MKTSGPFLENCPQNDQKSIRFITKWHMAFRHVGKPYKTCRKWRLLAGQRPPIWNSPRRAKRAAENFWGIWGHSQRKLKFFHLWGQKFFTLGAKFFSLCEAPPIFSLKFFSLSESQKWKKIEIFLHPWSCWSSYPKVPPPSIQSHWCQPV